MKRPRVFVSGAFSSKNGKANEVNIYEAVRYSRILAALGFLPFTPHTAFGFISEKKAEQLGISEDIFLDACLDILSSGLVHCIFMLPEWEKSEGAKAEHQLAVELGLYIIYTLNEAKEVMRAFNDSLLRDL